MKLRFVLAAPDDAGQNAAPGRAGAAAGADASPATARLQQAAKVLTAALNRHPDARRVMRHLHRLDRELAAHGVAGLDDLPLPVLERAADQLEAIAYRPPDPDLLHLLELLRIRLRAAEGTLPTGPQMDRPSDFLAAHKLEVREVSHSDFMHAHQELAAAPPELPRMTLEWDAAEPAADAAPALAARS